MMTNSISQIFNSLSAFQTVIIGVVLLFLFAATGFWAGSRSFLQRIKKIRSELDTLRKEVRAVFSIPVTTTIPSNLSDLLRGKIDLEVNAAQQADARESGPFLDIVEKLHELGPATFAYPVQSQESAVQIHDRLVDVFLSVSDTPEQIVQLFYENEFTQLFRLEGRLNSYFSDTKHASLTSLATALLCQSLSDRGISIHAPRPLSIADAEVSELAVEDTFGLGSLQAIRERVMVRQRLLANSSAENLLVIECLKPGFSEEGKITRPLLLVASKGW